MSYETLTVEKRQKGVVWLMIDHPPANAINESLMSELEYVMAELKDDEEARVIVVASRHSKTFLAGADLKTMVQNSNDFVNEENGIAKQCERMQACFQHFEDIPKPVIAAINGYAFGGGCELALACDFRLMGNGKIGLTEVNLGLIPGAGGTQRLTKLLGRAKATELIFMAKKLEAKEAEAIGLINRAVDPNHFEEEVTAFAEQLSEGAVKAMGLAKRAIHKADGSLAEGLKEEAQLFSETFLTDEPGIGLAAFFLKEKPQFIK